MALKKSPAKEKAEKIFKPENLLSLEYRNVRDLIPYINNTKIHSSDQINKIASSIKNFGFINPVIIDKDNEIIAGHGRVLASNKLGLESIPCLLAENLTPAQIRAYRIADNKIAEGAEWNNDLLKVELDFLKSEDFDLTLTGFELDEVNFLAGLGGKKEVKEDDFDPEPPKIAITKPGDLYELNGHRILCGDCTDVEAVEKLMGGARPI